MMIGLVAIVILLSGPSSAILYKNIRCDSKNSAYTTCPLQAAGSFTILDISVVTQDSSSPCIFDSSFGIDGSNIWVNNGCNGLFNVRACNSVSTVNCDSWNFAYATCDVPGGNFVSHVILKNQRSSSACTQYQTFGATTDKIWVSGGCRGSFLVCSDQPPLRRSVSSLKEKITELKKALMQ